MGKLTIVYANPYYIATHYDEVVLASKHSYMGNQRVATSLISQEFDHPGMERYLLPNQNETDRGYLHPTAGAWQDLQATLNCLLPEPVTIGGDMLCLNSIGTEIELAACAQPLKGEPGEGGVPEGGGLDALCACEQSLYWATQSGFDCASEALMYFYHPDYLGSVEFVSDMRGEPYQFFLNTPWGENLENQFAKSYTTFSSRFRFNLPAGRHGGKEWDEETGNFYYGARYYDPKLSLWLSVDPMAYERGWLTPYNFVQNNPMVRIDIDGRLDDIVFLNNDNKEIGRIITDEADIAIRVDTDIELPSPVEIDLEESISRAIEETGLEPDAVGISFEYSGVVGGGMTGGVEALYFLNGEDEGDVAVYGKKGGATGLDAEISGNGVAYQFNREADSKFFNAKGIEGKYSGYSAGFVVAGGYSWSNEDNKTALWPGQRGGRTTWSSFSIGGGVVSGGEIGAKIFWGNSTW